MADESTKKGEAEAKKPASEHLVELLVKAIAGVFVLVIAPVAVTVGTGYFNKKLEEKKETDPPAVKTPSNGEEKAETKTESTGKSESAQPSASKVAETSNAEKTEVLKPVIAAPAIAPKAPTELFNKTDLSGFSVILAPPIEGVPPSAADLDPRRVFQVEDGVLHAKGAVRGGLVSDADYEDYRLTIEYRRPEGKGRPANDRFGAVVVHAVAPTATGPAPWPSGLWCRFGGGGKTGELMINIEALPPLSGLADADLSRPQAKGKPDLLTSRLGGKPIRFSSGALQPFVEPQAKKKGESRENLGGDWNTLVITCDSDNVSVDLNEHRMNRLKKLTRAKGRIIVLTEGAELFIRSVRIEPPLPH